MNFCLKLLIPTSSLQRLDESTDRHRSLYEVARGVPSGRHLRLDGRARIPQWLGVKVRRSPLYNVGPGHPIHLGALDSIVRPPWCPNPVDDLLPPAIEWDG